MAGSRNLIDWLHARGRPFLFSSSHPPAVVAACLAGLDILENEPERIERLWSNTRFFKAGLTALGFDTGKSQTPITPVIIGGDTEAVKFSADLFDAGVFAQSIVFPTCERVRACPDNRNRHPDQQDKPEAWTRLEGGRASGII